MDTDVPRLHSLADTTQPLAAFYNEHTNRPRFLTVLSPTCHGCVQGAHAVRQAVLDAFQGPIGIVWLTMLEDDTDETIEQAAAEFADDDVTQFADPNRIAGSAIAESLGAEDAIAWDVYLYYDSAARWTGGPPKPTDWIHQLAPSPWTPRERYRCSCDGDLTSALTQLTQRIGDHNEP